MAPAENGRGIIIESSAATIAIAGRNLRIATHKIANRLCASIEAFDPERRDMPGDPQAPFVKSIRFYDPAEPEKGRPRR